MTVARLYRMMAAEGKEQAMVEALTALADVVRPVAGCLGVTLLRDAKTPGSCLFIEKWESVELHKAGAAGLPKGTFSPVMATLAGPPEAGYLDYLIDG
ncbi:MAG TPA: antibiotic biosynthesis monooxygenase family protein [Stellaceae bacterium]|nr:antibiotic biosynthesis monooxygenase family protein [Stellaceae bacterium]